MTYLKAKYIIQIMRVAISGLSVPEIEALEKAEEALDRLSKEEEENKYDEI